MRAGAFWIWAAMFAFGCAHYPVNPPLVPPWNPDGGYRFSALAASVPDPVDSADANGGDEADPDDEVFLVLTLSGGGTRAAAFSFGVLQALAATDLGDSRRMIDELDVISSVSGGSFAAAYYGLYGESAFFRDFPEAVLHRKLESDLAWRIFLDPRNWIRLSSRRFARSDLAERYYDDAIFGGKHYADLPRRRPFIVLNATDITSGAQFSFTQEHFDRLCSNLDGVTLSRAVTASSAFPLAFTPLTFDNRPKPSCGYETPIWVELAEQDFEIAPERWALARVWREYEDAERRPYIHLSDGGLADNIGLRIVTSGNQGGSPLDLYAKANRGEIRHLIVIVVDAMPRGEPTADLSPRPPGVVDVLNAAATKPMENYSAETIERVRAWFDEWDKAALDFQAIRDRCDQLATPALTEECRTQMQVTDADRPPHPDLTLLHVRFDAIPDADVRKRLESVPTRLQLPRPQVDQLVEWGRRLLEESDAYRQLSDELRTRD